MGCIGRLEEVILLRNIAHFPLIIQYLLLDQTCLNTSWYLWLGQRLLVISWWWSWLRTWLLVLQLSCFCLDLFWCYFLLHPWQRRLTWFSHRLHNQSLACNLRLRCWYYKILSLRLSSRRNCLFFLYNICWRRHSYIWWWWSLLLKLCLLKISWACVRKLSRYLSFTLIWLRCFHCHILLLSSRFFRSLSYLLYRREWRLINPSNCLLLVLRWCSVRASLSWLLRFSYYLISRWSRFLIK